MLDSIYFGKTIAIMVIGGIVSVSPAQGQERLTLDDAFAIALEANHDVQIARNERVAIRNRVNLGSAGLLPRVDLGASMNYRDDEAPASVGRLSSTGTQNSAALQASYTLFDGLSNIYTFKSLKKAGDLGDLQARNAIELTVVQVGRAYYNVANAQDQLVIAEEALAISRERYDRSELQAEYAQSTAVEVLSAQVDLNNDSASYLSVRLSLDEARRDLNLLLHRESSAVYEVDTAVTYMPAPDLSELKQAAFERNAAYLMSVTGLDRARLDRNAARSNWFPRLDLQMSYGYNKNASGFTWDYEDPTRSFTTFLSLNLNIFDGFQTRIRNQNATLTVRNQELYLDQARLDLERQVADAYDSYANSLSILALQRRNLEAATRNFEWTQELFNLGQVSTTTFREAQLNLIRAKSNISGAKYNARIDELDLLRLTGSLLEG